MNIIAFDSHKRYTLASVETKDSQLVKEERINHQRGGIRRFLTRCQSGSAVAVETIGNWYWIIDEIEKTGMQPKLVQKNAAIFAVQILALTDKKLAEKLSQFKKSQQKNIIEKGSALKKK